MSATEVILDAAQGAPALCAAIAIEGVIGVVPGGRNMQGIAVATTVAGIMFDATPLLRF